MREGIVGIEASAWADIVDFRQTGDDRDASEDGTAHNINTSGSAQGSNRSLSARGEEFTIRFRHPKMSIPARCNIHPWMEGFIHVLPHPIFAVTGPDGRYRLPPLPPGTYTIQVATRAKNTGASWLPVCGDIEAELSAMEPADRAEFMADLGLTTPGLDRLIQGVYRILGLQTFYTAGEKEIRAWTITRGTTAPAGAAVIHTDFERLFIRAQIYSLEDLVALGSEAAVKSAGKMRTEGRSYVLQENDVCYFLIGR